MVSHGEAGTLLSVIPTSFKGCPSTEQVCFVQTGRDESSLCLNKQVPGCGAIRTGLLGETETHIRRRSGNNDSQRMHFSLIPPKPADVPSGCYCALSPEVLVPEGD